MEFLQNLLDNSSLPVVTAFLLGLMTAISPCPLATNIAAIGYIAKDIENQRRIFVKGLLYTLGRILAYTLLGIILLAIIKGGSSLFGIQKFIGKFGEKIIGPILLFVGLYMLFGSKLNLPSFGFSGNSRIRRSVSCIRTSSSTTGRSPSLSGRPRSCARRWRVKRPMRRSAPSWEATSSMTSSRP